MKSNKGKRIVWWIRFYNIRYSWQSARISNFRTLYNWLIYSKLCAEGFAQSRYISWYVRYRPVIFLVRNGPFQMVHFLLNGLWNSCSVISTLPTHETVGQVSRTILNQMKEMKLESAEKLVLQSGKFYFRKNHVIHT